MSESRNDEGPVTDSDPVAGGCASGSGSEPVAGGASGSGSDSSDGRLRAGERDGLLAEAVGLREQGRQEEARDRLVTLAAHHPDDAEVAYQTAWAHDVLGLEAEAVPYYERALEAATGEGLSAKDRRGALLGLGSTFRVLGRYEEAVATLRGGVEEFPDDGALRTFLAMALYNIGGHHESTRLLLRLVAATSEDPGVRTYRRAIEHYAENLDETV